MSFISNAVRLIRRKSDKNQIKEQNNVVENSTELDFSLRNYAKESFSVLIKKPLSACMLKIMKITTFIITGIISGGLLACITCLILLQFGSIENTVITSFISDKIDKVFPDAELQIKNASFAWNSESKSFEIGINKMRINDFLIPHVSIQPDYLESIKAQNLVAKNISITNPKISLDIKDDLDKIAINPNFGIKSNKKSTFIPLNEINDFKQVISPNTTIKFINADILLSHNHDSVSFKNAYYECNANSLMPNIFASSITLEGQKYSSNFALNKTTDDVYKLKINSLNPDALLTTLNKLHIEVSPKLSTVLDGYNIPVSGDIDLKLEKGKISSGKFALSGINGSIKLSLNKLFSLNLGKKIDRGEIIGTFAKNNAKIDSLRMNYGNAGLQLTGVNIPLNNYKMTNKANIDGTLSLTNIDVEEMEAILPENITTSAVTPLKKCLPGFSLEEFRVDLKGSVALEDNGLNNLKIGQGTFTVKDAKIPVGLKTINHANASGIVMEDGVDIKIANAEFENIKINQGLLYIASKDGAAIGNMNVTLPINSLSQYSSLISQNLKQLPLDKLGINGVANLDLKVVSLNDQTDKSKFPFKVVQGSGFINTGMNEKKLQIAWTPKELTLSGDINSKDGRASIQFNEDFEKHTAHSMLKFLSKSDFLTALFPNINNILKGDYIITLNTDWKDNIQDSELAINLNNATMVTPFTGTLKASNSNGKFTAHVIKHDNVCDFSNMNFAAENNKFSGTMTIDEQGNVIRASLPDYTVNGISAKIQLLNKEKDHLMLSVIGNNMNFSQLSSFFNAQHSDVTSSIYVNLKELKYGTDKLQNVQGTIDVKNGKIIGGSCYGILGKDTTVTLAAKEVDGKAVTTISVSNAGDILKKLHISDAIQGGNLNIVLDENAGINGSQSGAFEITNCIVKDSKLLSKMISLSSVNFVSNTDNMSIGFNKCLGKFIFTDKSMTIDKCVALSPSITIAFSGKYDRINDALKATGCSLPMSSYYASNSDDVLMSPFEIDGSLGNPILSVKPMEYFNRDALYDMFGNTLPMRHVEESNSAEISGDIFAQEGFDKKPKKQPKQNVKPIQQKNGVTIVRGNTKNA